MIKILMGLVMILQLNFAEGISPDDIAKYQQYKSLLKHEDFAEKGEKNIVNEAPENNIAKSSRSVKNVSKEGRNIFQYDYDLGNLKRFGENFFQNKNNVNSGSIPSSDNYTLNNGDTIFINTYGTTESKTYKLKIDNNGNINIPSVGLLKVVSLRLGEAKTVVTDVIQKSFPNTKVIVDISGYSSIQVTVTGNVEVPGIYNLSSFSTIKDALIIANGLLETGSYRSIDLIRGGKVAYTFDLYDLINDTTKSNDVFLRNSDLLVVRFTQKSITFVGKVKNSAIYELKEKESYADLLKYSGGFTYDATPNSIKLTRYDEHKKLKSYLLNETRFLAMEPKDGDKVEVFNNLEIKETPYIYIQGKVVEASIKYKFYDGMKLYDLYNMVTFRSEIITKEGDREILYVDTDRIKVVRNNNDKKAVFLVSLRDNFTLKPFDTVEFFNYFDTHPREVATVKGEVYNPGEMVINNDTSLRQLIEMAGGLTEKAFMKEFELVHHEVVNDERVSTVKRMNLDEAMHANIKIHNHDEVNIYTIPNWSTERSVTLAGEVRFPGNYVVEKGEKLSSVIKRAGGFTDKAFIEGAVFSRESLRASETRKMEESMDRLKHNVTYLASNGKDAGNDKSTSELMATVDLLDKQMESYEAIGRLVIELDSNIEQFAATQYDVVLEDGDFLIIPTKNDTISVYGEVMNSNSFVYDEDLDAFDYIGKAGGLTEKADDDGIYVIAANGNAQKVSRGYLFRDTNTIKAGTTIIVPMKMNQPSNLLIWKDVSQVVYQLAITSASLTTVGAL